MSTLFNDTESFQKERPNKLSEPQTAEFYSTQADELIKQGFSESDKEDIIEDLKDLSPFSYNGYEMARDLESKRSCADYEIDTRFCEWLEGLAQDYRDLVKTNIKTWVKAHNIQPKFAKGTKLLAKETVFSEMKKDSVFYINDINLEEGYYLVDKNPQKRGGFVVIYERVEKSCVPADAATE